MSDFALLGVVYVILAVIGGNGSEIDRDVLIGATSLIAIIALLVIRRERRRTR